MNWNETAKPPRPVPEDMRDRARLVHSGVDKVLFDIWSPAHDELDRDYFGPQPAEPNARKTA